MRTVKLPGRYHHQGRIFLAKKGVEKTFTFSQTISSLFEMRSEEDIKLFVPCILQLQTLTVCPLFSVVLSAHGIPLARNIKHELGGALKDKLVIPIHT
jgi:hypothetical protein